MFKAYVISHNYYLELNSKLYFLYLVEHVEYDLELENKYLSNKEFPSVITVAVGKERWTNKVINNLTIKIVPAYAEVTDKNIPYLKILDVIANIKKIPDTLPDNVLNISESFIKRV